MSICSDAWIRRMARNHRMTEPLVEAQVREGVISYGLSSYSGCSRPEGNRWSS
jgi:dCTP deaminase